MEPDKAGRIDVEGHAIVEPVVHYVAAGHVIRHAAGTDNSEKPFPANPYPGLAPFGAEDTEWFFGRDRLLANLVGRLAERTQDGGPLIITGAAGSGKSSLLHAGLIPALRRDVLPGAVRWPILSLTPAGEPVMALAVAMARVLGVSPSHVLRRLRDDPASCVSLLREAVEERVVLIVDQLEELFTMCADREQRLLFVDLISRLSHGDPGGREPVALVVCGLRADFYAHCIEYPQLRDALQGGHVIVEPLSASELRQAISLPAGVEGLRFESGLTDLLMADVVVGDDIEQLPLLAHVLRTLWQNRRGGILGIAEYRSTGGIRDALPITAEAIFLSLDDRARQATRALFLRLLKVGDDTTVTRRRVGRQDLLRESSNPDVTSVVLDTFTRVRLLTTDQDTVGITQEVVLHAWPRLRVWIDDERAGRRVRQELEQAAFLWQQNGHAPALLLSGARLEVTRNRVGIRAPADDLTGAAREFLTASVRRDNRARRLRRGAIVALSALALLSTVSLLIQLRPRASGAAPVGWWWLALVALLMLIVAVLVTAGRVDQFLGRCWRAFRWVFGLATPKPMASLTRDQLERAAFRDVAGAYREVMTELNGILELRAAAVTDQVGGAR